MTRKPPAQMHHMKILGKICYFILLNWITIKVKFILEFSVQPTHSSEWSSLKYNRDMNEQTLLFLNSLKFPFKSKRKLLPQKTLYFLFHRLQRASFSTCYLNNDSLQVDTGGKSVADDKQRYHSVYRLYLQSGVLYLKLIRLLENTFKIQQKFFGSSSVTDLAVLGKNTNELYCDVMLRFAS